MTVKEKMLAVLADGMPHTPQELHACLNDELGPLSNIQPHLTYIRRVLRPKGQDISCETIGKEVRYRLVRLLASAYDGHV